MYDRMTARFRKCVRQQYKQIVRNLSVWLRTALYLILFLAVLDLRKWNEPAHEIMALIDLRKLNLQTRMRSNPLGLHVWYLVRPFFYFHTSCVRTAKALASARMRSLAWAFAVRLCDNYHNLWAGSNIFTCRQGFFCDFHQCWKIWSYISLSNPWDK